MPQLESVIFEALRSILARRDEVIEVASESHLRADLELDSLELAELSAILEDELGRDPYTEGVVPETVGEIIAFYDL